MLKESQYQVLGLMSGTSCDGLDIAHCKLRFANKQWQFEIIHADTYSYPDELQNTLKKVTTLSANDLALLDIDLGYFFARQINLFIDNNQLNKNEINFISSHGHTVFHQPDKKMTLQIGNGEAIFNYCGIPVINQFRVADVIAGGQGAPLVPIGDQLLFSNYDFCLNLGGIANISFDREGQRIAFDIGPQNLAINLVANRAGLIMDKNGSLARKGELKQDLKNEFEKFLYYQLPLPKSLGIENLQRDFFPIIEKSKYAPQDILQTLYHHLAEQISKIILENKPKGGNLLVTGGGAHNQFFIEILKVHLKQQVEVVIPQTNIVNFKEALVFAFLGVLRFRKEVNVLKSVTGADRNSIAGIMHGFQYD